MAWTFVGSAANQSGSASAATIAVTVPGVHAGDVVVVLVKWESGDTTLSVSDSTSALTEWSLGRQDFDGNDQRIDCFYLLGSIATGSVTYTATFGAARTWRSIVAMVYTPPAGTVAVDGTPAVNHGTGTSATSGNITTTGTDGVAFGLYGEFGASTGIVTINGGVPDHTQAVAGSQHDTMWSRAYSTGFTGQLAFDLNTSEQWIAGLIAFSAAGGGGGDETPWDPSLSASMALMGVGR